MIREGEKELRFIINGRSRTKRLRPGEKLSLLGYLRNELNLTGTKNGCGTGHCGACSVLINGKLRRACLLSLDKVDGDEIWTIEGVSNEGVNEEGNNEKLINGQKVSALHPVQQAFLDSGAIQCGFCTPGMVMATLALLQWNPDPSNEAIYRGLKYNKCRCTGYVKIIEAVKLAAQYMQAKIPPPSPEVFGLGASLHDLDGQAKVTGELKYAADIEMAGMLHARVAWAEHPHAELAQVDASAARKKEGVVKVLTWEDVPGRNGHGALNPDQPILCRDKVRYLGDPVALVVAQDEASAEAALAEIQVEYRPLEGLYSPEEALNSKENIHLNRPQNLCKHLQHQLGKVEEAKEEAEVAVKGRFQTPFVEHGYLEPEAGVAYVEVDPASGVEVLTIIAPTQFPFEMRKQMAAVLDWPEERIRIKVSPLGGGFGSRCDATVEYMVALAAYHTRKPVKLVFDREETMRMSTKRHPYKMDYEVGAYRDGRLAYVDAFLCSDAGPYTNLSPRVIDQACIFACGPYRVPHVQIEGYAVHTNNANSSALRGFGINQSAFAMESLLDELAEKLSLDPLRLREQNALQVGDSTISGEVLTSSVAIQKTIQAVKARLPDALRQIKGQDQAVGPKERPRAKQDEREHTTQNTRQLSGKKIGVGIASGYKNVGAGKGKTDDAGAVLELTPEGKIQVRVSAVDMGQGIRTTMVQIASETLQVPVGMLKLITGDTSLTPRHNGAVAQRQTYISGNALKAASEDFRDQLLRFAADQYWLDYEGLYLEKGKIRMKTGEDLDTIEEILAKAASQSEVDLYAEHTYEAPQTYPLSDQKAREEVPRDEYKNYPTYAYTTQAAIVAVDEQSGEVDLLKVIAAHDVGRAINPQKIHGQIQGSCFMAQGYALREAYPVRAGQHLVKTYRDLNIPGIEATPDYEIEIIEDPEPSGPFDAKGISEVATVPLTPAIINAIYHAVGVRIRSLPATPEKIKAALRSKPMS